MQLNQMNKKSGKLKVNSRVDWLFNLGKTNHLGEGKLVGL